MAARVDIFIDFVYFIVLCFLFLLLLRFFVVVVAVTKQNKRRTQLQNQSNERIRERENTEEDGTVRNEKKLSTSTDHGLHVNVRWKCRKWPEMPEEPDVESSRIFNRVSITREMMGEWRIPENPRES